MNAMKIMYVANILVAGGISLVSMSNPSLAARTIFSNAYNNSEVIRLVGCLWFAIAILSSFGLFRPETFSPVLVLQLIYKGTWLLIVAVPAIMNHKEFPSGMAVFFLVWVLILPFVIPWKYLLTVL